MYNSNSTVVPSFFFNILLELHRLILFNKRDVFKGHKCNTKRIAFMVTFSLKTKLFLFIINLLRLNEKSRCVNLNIMALFDLSVLVSHDSMTVSPHSHQDPGKKTVKAIVYLIFTPMSKGDKRCVHVRYISY